MTKTFSKDTLLSIGGFIYLVDKEAKLVTGDYRGCIGDRSVWLKPFDSKTQSPCEDCGKIIATNNPSLEGVAKIDLEEQEIVESAKSFGKFVYYTGMHFRPFRAGYKAASSKKKYTKDDIKTAFDAGITALIAKGEDIEKQFFQGKPKTVDIKVELEKLIQSLKPVPTSIEIEWEAICCTSDKSTSDCLWNLDDRCPRDHVTKWRPKLKDGYVIIKEVKYE